MPADEIPELGLGTWQNTDPEECAESVRTALETGYRHIDTAQAYDNEAYVGDGITQAAVDREDIFLATKVWTDNLSYDDVHSSTETSLDKLGAEYLDLLYIHWPAREYGPEETLRAFDDLRAEGTIRNIGVSNFTPDLLDEARDLTDGPILANQVEMHPLLQQRKLQEYAVENDIFLVAYSPLARGDVFGVDVLSDIAAKHGANEAQVSLAWLVAKENVVAIPKATSEEHIRDNYEALSLDLDPEDIERIDDIDREERLVDPDFAPNW